MGGGETVAHVVNGVVGRHHHATAQARAVDKVS